MPLSNCPDAGIYTKNTVRDILIIEGSVDVCPAVPRRTVAVSRDDAVAIQSTDAPRGAPVCSKDTYWDS